MVSYNENKNEKVIMIFGEVTSHADNDSDMIYIAYIGRQKIFNRNFKRISALHLRLRSYHHGRVTKEYVI